MNTLLNWLKILILVPIEIKIEFVWRISQPFLLQNNNLLQIMVEYHWYHSHNSSKIWNRVLFTPYLLLSEMVGEGEGEEDEWVTVKLYSVPDHVSHLPYGPHQGSTKLSAASAALTETLDFDRNFFPKIMYIS